jgi:chromosome segregation ATPase
MKTPTLRVLRACTLTIALLGSAAIVAAISLPDVAFAKSGNEGGNGNGNGGGNGNGNGGGNGNGNGNAKSNGNGGGNGSNTKASGGGETQSTKAKGAEASKKTKVSAKTKRLADELGVSASELGALNAAHANANAFKNAAPNSRVGRIGAYRTAVLEGRELEAELAEKQALLDALTPPDRPASEVAAELDDAVEDVAAKARDVAQLEDDLAAAGGADPAIEAELDLARDALAEAEATEEDLRGELANAAEYAALDAEVQALEEAVEEQPQRERDLLEAAANKPVTDAVEAAVKKLLGL